MQSTVAVGAVAAASGVRPVVAQESTAKSELPEGGVILFQGDSITDAGRDRNAAAANDVKGLGHGYPHLLAASLLHEYAASKPKVFNRGISGNKVPDLQARWEADCVALQPTVLSILIGVNDIWHKLNGNYAGTVADYETGFRGLLKSTRERLPETRIVICEPFVTRTGAVKENWFPEFDERRSVAKKLAEELSLTFVPFQSAFDAAVEVAPPEYWAYDGVHPTLAGHALMASEWRKATGI
jgi:lysophospholipase L1-like esterase